ncbi:MAG TPA: hypothetical protein VFV38_35710 [Ktedonobacteraceae bacterium]|nr:hypothetical protein [Ktedonobacteraceae bacterium]
MTYSALSTIQKRLLSGFLSSEISGSQTAAHTTSALHSTYFPSSDDGCPQNLGENVKVNQNCLNLTDTSLQGRGQAQNETAIAQDPLHPNNLVATYNDYRRGDGNCYGSFSRDGGRSWTDSTIPMGFTNGAPFGGVARQYWQAGGDTSVAWDTRGNAYFSCQVFMRGPGTTNNPDLSSAFYIFRSTGNDGASWNFPGRLVFGTFTQNSAILNDKQYMTIDNHLNSPFRDRIYVTWTIFAADGTAYIYEAHSSDYGETFSTPVVVSTTSSLCVNTFGAATPNGTCNANQDSQPFTGPDGALYVVYSNFNNALSGPNDNHNQILLSKSTDGGATFSAPVLVGNFNDLPDCATYQGGQDAGRACVPEKGASMTSVFRAGNYASGAVDPANGAVIVTFGSYINKDSNPSNGCVPAGFGVGGGNAYTGVKTVGACNNKILESISTNGGASFNGTVTDPTTMTVVSSAQGQATTDQWWQWAAFTRDGKLAVSYYDRQYGNDETTGLMDFSLSGSRNLQNFGVRRVTSSSMPVPTEFPDAQGNSTFFGDYTGLAAVDNAHPIWMDTRSPDLVLCPGTGVSGVPPRVCTFTSAPNGPMANDQEIFTSSEDVPSR